jgi:hypothetical protein
VRPSKNKMVFFFLHLRFRFGIPTVFFSFGIFATKKYRRNKNTQGKKRINKKKFQGNLLVGMFRDPGLFQQSKPLPYVLRF